jgi:hypothetical protein
VLAIGTDFSVYTSFWKTGNTWSGIEDEWKIVGSAIPGATFTSSDIIAISQSPALIDVLVSCLDGNIHAALLFDSTPSKQWTTWQSLGEKTFTNPLKFEFTAVSRNNQTWAALGCGLIDKLWAAE